MKVIAIKGNEIGILDIGLVTEERVANGIGEKYVLCSLDFSEKATVLMYVNNDGVVSIVKNRYGDSDKNIVFDRRE